MGAITKRSNFLWRFTLFIVVLSFVTIFALRAIKKSFEVESFHVGVYWNPKCTKEVTSIEWGKLILGSTNDVNIFLRSEELDLSCFMFL